MQEWVRVGLCQISRKKHYKGIRFNDISITMELGVSNF